MIVFFRYRHVWTRSSPDEWEVINRYVDDNTDLHEIKESIFEEFQDERGHWDGYRGIDIEHIEEPSWDIIIEEIDRCTRSIDYYTEKRELLHAMLPPPKEDSDEDVDAST